jgi:mannose-6-phosphate isomerase
MLPDVIRLQPIVFERPWGGRRLERLGRSLPARIPVGESWEIADLAADDSGEYCTLVADGPLAGARLVDLIDRYGTELLGSAGRALDGRFPLLVKLLDAREHLSVQVHPPDRVADLDPTVRAKDESWYVMDVEADARMWFDVRSDVSDEELASAVGDAGVVDLLGELPARVGDFHHIPAGRVHALGAGVMVFEVQTPSDTTFRIYDWVLEYGRPARELHPVDALASIVRGDPSAISVSASEIPGSRKLVDSTHYWIREHRSAGDPIRLDPRAELRVLLVANGDVELGSEVLSRGAVRVLPAVSAAIGDVNASPGAVLVETGIA